MKLKFLLFSLLMTSGFLYAQDTIKTLIITEIRLTHHEENFVEITNIGDKAVQLSDFEFGLIRPWNNVPWTPESPDRSYMLPEKMLNPGESFVMATVCDFGPKMFRKGSDDYRERITKQEMWTLADYVIHIPEALKNEQGDSVSGSFWWTWETQNGRGCYYLRQHLSETDSVVIDQVGGVFDGENGLNRPGGYYDVAGIAGATGNSILIRKSNVKAGNLDFANARGVGEDDSEWIPVPIVGGAWRDVFWTLGNHGDYKLDASTLESEVIGVDFANKKLSVPWGIRSNDDIMHNFKRKPGIAWKYEFSPIYDDSLFMSARTGDKLKIYVSGNKVDVATFDIIVKAPLQNANMVIPKYNADPEGLWRDLIHEGEIEWPRVTRNKSGIDTITGARFGIPYATRVDSLFKVLEKAPKASWEIIWIDGIKRADLKDGDILKITAENGDVKQYYIQVRGHRPSHNSQLSAITWPDIPSYYIDAFGWTGDTIPGFNSGSFNYKIEVPADIDGIPALIAKTADLNAKVEVSRATSLNGSIDQRTLKFTVTAEDDTSFSYYTIEFVKQKSPNDIQPFYAEPIISQFVFWIGWGATNLWEIANPGNQPLDLSNYMIVGGPLYNPADAITVASETDDWADRYRRYIPGYKWVNDADWAASPGMVELDLNVSPIVFPGDVFVLGSLNSWAGVTTLNNIDIDFANNPWGEPVGATCASNWSDQNFFIFKILNDSIKRGLKPATDVNDFELIETFGTGDGSTPYGWFDFNATVTRKPEYYEGKTGFKESFGTGWWHTSEWDYKDAKYWAGQNVYDYLAGTWDIGKHYMYEPTHYKSTVSSAVYKVSEGYGLKESIRGPKTGTTVAQLIGNIVKENEKQTLKVKGTVSGNELAMDAVLSMNDTLIVISADSVNTTKYILQVTPEGLSSNALLTSTKYVIKVDNTTNDENADKGTVSGFEYGTSLRTVLANLTLPAEATMQVIDNEGAYVSLKRLNFDTTYVNVTVNHNMFLEVIAENGTTKITYQLQPDISENDAFLTSDVYSVIQKELLIDFVPRGTIVSSFLENLVPSLGASLKLIDKMGIERINGYVADDDKVVVTSSNGMVSKVYFISRLSEKYVLETTYLAYILSVHYQVDQEMYKVAGVSGDETIASFLSKITPSSGATAMVVDKNGIEKINGDINGGDMVKVTSADGKINVYYTFGPLTAASEFEVNNIQLYPNPTNGLINVSGLKSGYRIQVYNSVGSVIRNIKALSNMEIISLEGQPSGLYMIVISHENKMLERFKVLKQ
jgi:hypothetical protein